MRAGTTHHRAGGISTTGRPQVPPALAPYSSSHSLVSSSQQLTRRAACVQQAASTAAAAAGGLSGGGEERSSQQVALVASTSSSSSSDRSWSAWRASVKAPRYRPNLGHVSYNYINWTRWENNVYRRLQEQEDAEGAGDGADADSTAATAGSDPDDVSALDEMIAASDLSAAYFQWYDDPAAHQASLRDRPLLQAWRDAFDAASRLGLLEGKVVLDVGCGLGVLSMMAAKAGAARVYAVDGSSGATDAARRIVKANGLADKVTVITGAVEDVELPEQVDVVVSNWMGHGLLAEGMMHSVAAATRKWLRPGGLVLPDRASLWAVGLEDRDALQAAKDDWNRVAGFDMTGALAQAIRHPRRDVLTRKTQLFSAPQRLGEWDMAALRPSAVTDPATGEYLRSPWSLTALRDERLFGLLLYFQVAFTLGGKLRTEVLEDDNDDAGGGGAQPPVVFTTHPLAATTHYQQLMVTFPRSIRLAADEVVSGTLVARPGAIDPRDLELEVTVDHGGVSATAQYRVAQS